MVEKKTCQFAPKSHNLIYLCDLANISLPEDDNSLLSVLMKYQLEGRYPEYYPKVPPKKVVNDYLCKTKALLECLKKML